MTSTERRNRVDPARRIVAVLAAGAVIGTLTVALRMQNGPGTIGLGFAGFIGMWTLMMTAMMLPSISQNISDDTGRQTPPGTRGISAFAAGYLIVWALAGVAAFPYAAHVKR